MEQGKKLSTKGAWHSLPANVLATEFRTNLDAGLSAEEARRRQACEGFNELPEARRVSLLSLFLSQFTSVIVGVLIAAAVISGFLEDWVDAAAIMAIVFLNGLLGFVQEFRAERSLAALRKMSVAMARVVRDGALCSIPARELVPGDLILLEPGDRIPADARVIYATNFQTQEASLTGESTPVQKGTTILDAPDVSLADRTNMAFMGTTVVSGKSRTLVVATGIRTELGRIAAMIQMAAEAERTETPLQRRLEQFGYTLLWLALAVVTAVFALGYLRGEPLLAMFLTAVSLAVAAIPEGLPAIVTITLALGVSRMVMRHALIRKLPAVETLGSATVICTDKTGTLTKNEMTVTRLYVDGCTFEVTGEGYAPVGEIREVPCVNRELAGAQRKPVTAVCELLTAAVLCNSAELRSETAGGWTIVGDPTEGALVVAAAKAGLSKSDLERKNPALGEIPFDSERKKMTVVRQTKSRPVAYVKGAPDVLLRDCLTWMTRDGRSELLTEEIRQQVLSANQQFASQALRVLGVAMRPLDQVPDGYRPLSLERELTYLGSIGMKDPIRPEAKAAVEACRTAGIRTVMITGDHQDTAVAIANDLGIMDPGAQAMSGAELNELSDEELRKRVKGTAVYARVSAEHKLRVVLAWKQQGAIVAMTGDGVNDAPALKAADIGVAMGITGTDVTKEASDMVVTDDNFASIAAAVEEGRGVYENIRKSIHYLLSCNVSEIVVMLLATVFALPLPLLPVQILWINLVTDGLPALALAVDPQDPDLMRQPPRHPQVRILDRERIYRMVVQGLFMAAITIAAFVWCLHGMENDLQRARTLTFTILVFVQLSHAFNCRSDRYSLFRIGFWTNKPLVWAVVLSVALQAAIILIPWAAEVFQVATFYPGHWLLAFGVGLLPLAAMEVWKMLSNGR